MWHTESKHRDAMRHGLGRSIFGRWSAFLLLCIMLAVPGISHASCPDFTPPNASVGSPVPSGGTIVIDVPASCSGSGFLVIGDVTTPATHGTAQTTDYSNRKITYTNNGDGATTDSFKFDDGLGGTDPAITVTLNIAPHTSPISITPTTLPSGTVAVPYSSTTLTASGGTSPYTYAVTGGTLPAGLTLSSGGVISGTPTTDNTYSFTVTATDSASVTGIQSYTVTIAAPSVHISNTPTDPVINAPYSFTFTATGGTAPYTYTLDGGTTLPAGLVLASNGTISGTPTALGLKSFTVRATDSGGFFSASNFTVTVQNLPPPVANPVSATVAYNSTNNPITLNITGGAPASVAVGTNAAHGTLSPLAPRSPTRRRRATPVRTASPTRPPTRAAPRRRPP